MSWITRREPKLCFSVSGAIPSDCPFGRTDIFLRVGSYAATSARSYNERHSPNAYPERTTHTTTMAIDASTFLEWTTSSRAASASTLLALGRSNDGVCDRQRQPVPHRLSVRAAWRAMQHRGTARCVRIARPGGTDAGSSHDRGGRTRMMQRGVGDGCES